MSRETRGARLGRAWAADVRYKMGKVPRSERQTYLDAFLAEVRTFSFDAGNDKRELDGIDDDPQNPVYSARFFKENLHTKYQKDTARRIYKSLLANLGVTAR